MTKKEEYDYLCVAVCHHNNSVVGCMSGFPVGWSSRFDSDDDNVQQYKELLGRCCFSVLYYTTQLVPYILNRTDGCRESTTTRRLVPINRFDRENIQDSSKKIIPGA